MTVCGFLILFFFFKQQRFHPAFLIPDLYMKIQHFFFKKTVLEYHAGYRMLLHIFHTLKNEILFVCPRIKFPEVGMETDLKNFNTGFKISFRTIWNPHTSVIKLHSGIQKYNDKYFTDILDLINRV